MRSMRRSWICCSTWRLTCPRLCAARSNNQMDATTEPALSRRRSRRALSASLPPGNSSTLPLPTSLTTNQGPTRASLTGTVDEHSTGPDYDLEEPSMADKLAALNLPAAGDAEEEQATTAVVPPSADSVHVLLRQTFRSAEAGIHLRPAFSSMSPRPHSAHDKDGETEAGEDGE